MYICSNCQKEYNKWQGQCDNCGLWNTIIELEGRVEDKKATKKSKLTNSTVNPVKLSELEKETKLSQIKTGISEFDNAIGGRMVQGQVILFSGEPGIGKSTLTLQIIETLSNQGLKIIYIAGEESPHQIKERADRLKLKLSNVLFLPEVNVDNLERYISSHAKDIDFIVADSIQTLINPQIASSSGSVSQVAEATNRITSLSKGLNITTLMIGHVTKSGDIAGPKIVEHMVDTVIYFEGEKRYEFRVLRIEKNRFGPSDEVGIFRMGNNGLTEVSDTKELLSESKNDEPGSVFSLVMEGSRPVAVEVQALATKTYFPNPRRTTSGFDLNRLYILLAIIDKKLKIPTWDFDVYVNITGGIKITDPGLDLAVITAVISSIKDKNVSSNKVYFGEVGLTGEIRKVYFEDKRIKEAKRIGFQSIVSNKEFKNVKDISF